MHILGGALLGAVLSVVATVVVAHLAGRRPTLKQLLAAAVGGAVGGGIAAATLGGSVVAASVGRQVLVSSGAGASAGTAERATSNALHGRPLDENLGRAAATGAVIGPVAFGAGRAAVAATRDAARRVGTDRIVAATGPSVGNAVARGVDRATRPLTGKSIAETQRPREEEPREEEPVEETAPAPPPAPSRGLRGVLAGM